jgi:predicted ester cyclase
VGPLEYRGLDGVRRSTDLYRALLDDPALEVLDRIEEGDRVASRWVMTGSSRGRSVRVGGITISRLRDGLMVEDWSSFDTFELLRGLAVVRVLRAAPRMPRAMRDARVSDA